MGETASSGDEGVSAEEEDEGLYVEVEGLPGQMGGGKRSRLGPEQYDHPIKIPRFPPRQHGTRHTAATSCTLGLS